MPSAIERDRELSSRGLVTILMERQGADQATLEAFLAKHFPDNRAMACVGTWTPLPSSGGLPHAALVGVDGTLLWTGNPISGESRIEELVQQELRKRSSGFGATDAEVDARKQIYGMQDYEEALDVPATRPRVASAAWPGPGASSWSRSGPPRADWAIPACDRHGVGKSVAVRCGAEPIGSQRPMAWEVPDHSRTSRTRRDPTRKIRPPPKVSMTPAP